VERRRRPRRGHAFAKALTADVAGERFILAAERFWGNDFAIVSGNLS
jgi:hypothetical protein